MRVERQIAPAPVLPGLRPGFPVLQRKCACGGSAGPEGECEECRQNAMSLQRRAGGGGSAPAAVPPIVHNVLRSPGQPLDTATRAFMEPRFGHDFRRIRVHPEPGPATRIVPASDGSEMEAERLSDSIVRGKAASTAFDFSRIRIHADSAAGDSARAIDSLAYTAGHHIVFGPGQYRPDTADGRRLLAHELVHTVQQTGHGGVLQRQATGVDAPMSARAIFPYPEKSRLLVNLLLSDENLEMIAKFTEGDPDSALALGILRASEGQIATVTAATDDLFEAVVPSVTLPAHGSAPAQTVKNATLRFSRQPSGKFRFALAADPGTGPKELFAAGDITAKKEDGDIRLSPGKGPSAKIVPGPKPGQVEVVGDVGIFDIDALRLTKLPDAPPGSEAEKKLVQESTKAAKEERRERRQQVTAGAGAQVTAGKVDPVFAASWRTSFTPFVKLGDVVQIPLRVQIDYAPDKSVLGGVSSGAGVSIPSKIPVNVRLDLGVAGGEVRGGPASGGGKGPLVPGFGPTVGAGVGIGLGKTFRMEVDYRHLQNVVHNSPNADTVVLGVGAAF